MKSPFPGMDPYIKQCGIDYSRPLTPPLTAEEVAWLEQQAKSVDDGR